MSCPKLKRPLSRLNSPLVRPVEADDAREALSDLAADVHVARPLVDEEAATERERLLERVDPDRGLARGRQREARERVVVVLVGQAGDLVSVRFVRCRRAGKGHHEPTVDLVDPDCGHADAAEQARRVQPGAGADAGEVDVGIQRDPGVERHVDERVVELAVADHDAAGRNDPLLLGRVHADPLEQAELALPAPDAVATLAPEVQVQVRDLHQADRHVGQVDLHVLEDERAAGGHLQGHAGVCTPAAEAQP